MLTVWLMQMLRDSGMSNAAWKHVESDRVKIVFRNVMNRIEL